MISVIVPIYNAEKYLSECVESILNQTYTDLEIILIDDGSRDASLQICRKYQEADDRVKVFHKENSGVSATRNMGLEHATGAYVSFCDADDVLMPALYESLLEKLQATGADSVCGGYAYLYDDGHQLSHRARMNDGLYTQKELLPIMIDDGTLTGFLFSCSHSCLFKRDIIEENRIRLCEGVRYNEDGLFCLEYVLHSQSLYCMQSQPLYLKRMYGESVSANLSDGDNFKQLHLRLQELCAGIPEADLPRQMARRKVTLGIWSVLAIAKKKNGKTARQEIKEIICAIPADNYALLDMTKTSRYKKIYGTMMKMKQGTLLYITSKWVVPFLSKYLSR